MSKRGKRQRTRQRPKHGGNLANRERWDAFMEIRRSNAAVPIPSGTTYNRSQERQKIRNGRFDD